MVGTYRPTVACALSLLAFAVVSITWAFHLMDAAAQAESLASSKLVVRHVADFISQVGQATAPSDYRQSLLVLVGTIVLISVASVGTVAYLNIALVRARDLLKSHDLDAISLDIVKERFLTSVTHELNTPITVATALTDALARNREVT